MKSKIIRFIAVMWIFIVLFSTQYFAKITIKEQPKSQCTRLGGNIVLIVKAKAKNRLRYQWYVSEDGRNSWHKVPYETSRRIVVRCDKTKMNGWYYRCKIKEKYQNVKWSKSAKITITDIGVKYSYELDSDDVRGLFMPKAADGYCYVYCYNKTFSKQTKNAIETINKAIGKTFVYTPTAAIADIVIVDQNNTTLKNNMFLKDGEIDIVNKNGNTWMAATFNINSIHYLITLNSWYLYLYWGKPVESVIIHELGHCVGLNHSESPQDIMYHIYNGNYKMTKNDIINFKNARQLVRNIGKHVATENICGIDSCYGTNTGTTLDIMRCDSTGGNIVCVCN